MLIERIVTLANRDTEILFRAMERSLRATGCALPIDVIPYNESRFCLPKGSRWLENDILFNWLEGNRCHPTMRKYLSLTIGNYQYIDTDAIFLKDPETFLAPFNGLTVSCTEWSRSLWIYQSTYTNASQKLLAERSSLWRRSLFSSGQFACEPALYTVPELLSTCERKENRQACMEYTLHEQPGINLLVALSGINLSNLTLPPYNFESSLAIDYAGEYESLWQDEARMPYVIHYAGHLLDQDLPINQIFFRFLNSEERAEFEEGKDLRSSSNSYLRRWPTPVRLLNLMLRLVDNRFYVQPKP
jgi:hypothetical protein